jgi:hypothetical protein
MIMKKEIEKKKEITALLWVEHGYEYGRDEAPEGKVWVQNCMNNHWVLEDENTPYCNSVRSESYFAM